MIVNKEMHNCNDCIHESVCEWAVYSEDITCKDFIDKKVLSERPQGEWVNGDDKCHCCGKSKFENLDADIWSDWKPNYCPNCGADMRKEADNE